MSNEVTFFFANSKPNEHFGRSYDESIHKFMILDRLTLVAAGLSLYFRILPKCKFSTVLFPDISPEDSISEAIEMTKTLVSPYLLVAGHHQAYEARSGDQEGSTRKNYVPEAIAVKSGKT